MHNIRIRALRIIEYEFESFEQMDKTFARGAVPLNGAKTFGTVTIRSAAINSPFHTQPIVAWEDATTED